MRQLSPDDMRSPNVTGVHADALRECVRTERSYRRNSWKRTIKEIPKKIVSRILSLYAFTRLSTRRLQTDSAASYDRDNNDDIDDLLEI